MARPRTVSDRLVLDAVREIVRTGGDRAATFSAVASASGLSPPSLVQRYGSRDDMVRTALLAGWTAMEAALDTAEAAAPLTPKGAAALLKALEPAAAAMPEQRPRDAALAKAATAWRERVETALAVRLGSGGKDRAGAAILFAAWQGRLAWSGTFRLKEAAARLAPAHA